MNEQRKMRKYGESKTIGIMKATVPHVTSGLGLRKFQADGFLLTRVYIVYTHLFMIGTTCKKYTVIQLLIVLCLTIYGSYL